MSEEAVGYIYSGKVLTARKNGRSVMCPRPVLNKYEAEKIIESVRTRYGIYDLPKDWYVEDPQREPESSGGHCEYYHAPVDHPQNPNQTIPYIANCEDIIQALGLTFDEGCEFKSIWRRGRSRQGYLKAESTALRDAAKAVHYAQRVLAYEQRKETK